MAPPSPRCTCNCLNSVGDTTPFALRPVRVGKPPHNQQLHLLVEVMGKPTEIEEIRDFHHPNAAAIKSACDVPKGEGAFLVKWKGHNQQDWINGDAVFEKGLTAIRKYFANVAEKRKANEKKYLDKLTHISSLYDILSGGIECETKIDYKLKIGGLSDDFLFELAHPVWGQKITKHLEIVREKGECYVWASHLQVRSVFRADVSAWEDKQRTFPTAEEIEKMDWFEIGRHLIRKEEGFYYNSEDENSSSDGGSCEAGDF